MSRTFKDAPIAVQVHQGNWSEQRSTVYAQHSCLEHNPSLVAAIEANPEALFYRTDGGLWRQGGWIEHCDLAEFTYYPNYYKADLNGQATCINWPTWRGFNWKPSSSRRRIEKQKPFRQRERRYAHQVVREFNSGIDDFGDDELSLPVWWKGPKAVGGGYWD